MVKDRLNQFMIATLTIKLVWCWNFVFRELNSLSAIWCALSIACFFDPTIMLISNSQHLKRVDPTWQLMHSFKSRNGNKTSIIIIRRNLKCVRFNAIAANAVDTKSANRCAKLELNSIISKPIKKHPQEYKQNATRYETMNRPKVIKTAYTNNQLISSIDKF